MYEHDANGNPIIGDVHDLADLVINGADVKVATLSSGNAQSLFNCEWVYAANDGSFVTCKNTSHISVRAIEGGDFGFKDNAYHWFVMVNTEGKRDMSR
ncbi:MAG: hypothetical protein ABFS56_33205 [Pseudomonadota bacterium]